MEITCIEDLQLLVLQGVTDWNQYGEVIAKEKDGLIHFNYTPMATFLHRWNWFERNARGLILDRITGEVVARPFEKIFNWGEEYENVIMPLAYGIVRITEKMDGSLGILYRKTRNIAAGRRYAIATRGSFESPQADWATNWLYRNHHIDDGWLPEECTLLFEIIYPENRIVVDYHGQSMLTLLTARNRYTGEYYSDKFLAEVACHYKFHPVVHHNLPKNAKEIARLVKDWDNNTEGVVCEFDNGSRWKFKAESYLQVHRLLSRLSFKRVLEAMREGTIDDILPLLPPHIRSSVITTMDEITQVCQTTRELVFRVFNNKPYTPSRKEFALWALGDHKAISGYLFALYDGKDILDDIFRKEFKSYTPKSTLVGDTLDEEE
jgi:RNA ligase